MVGRNGRPREPRASGTRRPEPERRLIAWYRGDYVALEAILIEGCKEAFGVARSQSRDAASAVSARVVAQPPSKSFRQSNIQRISV